METKEACKFNKLISPIKKIHKKIIFVKKGINKIASDYGQVIPQ